MGKKRSFRRVSLSNWGYMSSSRQRALVTHRKESRPRTKKAAQGVTSISDGMGRVEFDQPYSASKYNENEEENQE